MIGIIDYGLGNINAFYRMLNEENIDPDNKSEEEFKNYLILYCLEWVHLMME